MVACTKCALHNTLDSIFCRKCGAELPVELLEEEQQKLKELVTTGMESYQSGNSDEALAIADHAIMTNPSYAEAYALRGMVKERKGEYAEALDAFETVVSLNPDSTIDKIKLNQLRNAFAQRTAGEPAPDRRMAGIMAIAATLLVIGTGTVFYRLNQNSTEKNEKPNLLARNTPNLTNMTGAANMGAPQSNQATLNNSNQTNPGSSTNDPNDVPPISTSGTPNSGQGNSGSRPTRGGGGPSPLSGALEPIIIPEGMINKPGTGLPDAKGGTVEQGGGNNNNGNPNGGVDPRPAPGGVVSNPTQSEPEEPKGTYDIKISAPGKDGATDNNGSQALKRTGTERMKSGDADGAAKAFGKANESGGNGKSYLRQAQALARQGKNSEAAEAYSRAITALEAEIASGKGDKDSLKASLSVAKQALKNLKG